jgi:hypothetical protein
MKQKDIALILAVVIASGIISLVIGRLVFAAPKNRQQKVEVVDVISTEFSQPDSKYFNAQSLNPTQLIRISENSNATPFNGTTQ